MYSRKRAYETSVNQLSILIKKRNNVLRLLRASEERTEKLKRRLWLADGRIVKFAEATGRHI